MLIFIVDSPLCVGGEQVRASVGQESGIMRIRAFCLIITQGVGKINTKIRHVFEKLVVFVLFFCRFWPKKCNLAVDFAYGLWYTVFVKVYAFFARFSKEK